VAHVYGLRTWLWLPRPRAEVFEFFSDARNLERITPPFLRFEVLSPQPIVMRQGALIDYRLGFRGVPLRWRTEIKAWDPPDSFVDTQLRGPYREWIHTHRFSDQDAGTLVEDQVAYRLWGPSLLTGIVHRLLVGPDTRRIFEFRHAALKQVFGAEGRARVGAVSIEANRTP
jgi:ligand-binding SRPBCC domain-containing protein